MAQGRQLVVITSRSALTGLTIQLVGQHGSPPTAILGTADVHTAGALMHNHGYC